MNWRATFLVIALLPASALAQDELGLGLDLTEPTVAPEFKPSLALIEITPVPATPEEGGILRARADALNVALLPAAMQGDAFSRVLSQEDSKAALGAELQGFLTCAAVECLEQLTGKLDVDRVITGQLVQVNGETKLSLTGYDRGAKQLFTAEAESAEKAMKQKLSGFSGLGGGKSQAQKDREFLTKANGPLYAMIGNLKTPLGTVDIRSYEPDVEVTLNGKKAGQGSFSKTLAAGEYALHAESPNVLPYETKFTVESQKVTELALTLTARPKVNSQAVFVEKPQLTTPLYKRPGLYVAIAGAVALGVGAVIGSSAKGIESRATDADGDGVLDVTRAEAMGAKSSAMTANILMGVGGAALVGGGIWMFVAPGTAKGTVDGPVVEPEGSGGGFTVGLGGSF